VGGGLGVVWMGAENFTSTGFHFPDHPAHSESLYQRCYPGAQCTRMISKVLFLSHCACYMNTLNIREPEITDIHIVTFGF